MRRKHMLSLLLLCMGVALLIAATTVGVASSATQKASSSKALRGGTLRVNQSAGAFDTLDPGLAYVTNDWEVLYSTGLNLVNFPNKAGQAPRRGLETVGVRPCRRYTDRPTAVGALGKRHEPIGDSRGASA